MKIYLLPLPLLVSLAMTGLHATNLGYVESFPHPEPVVVHEWGTFTSLQDETGRTLAGINTDDEKLPDFVYRLKNHLTIEPTDLAPVYYKGVPRLHPHVTMRLETPVVYFYLPENEVRPVRAHVRVDFQGGWLTEYYPFAQVDAPGLQEQRFRFGPIQPETVGSLEWPGLKVGGAGIFPETDSPVWLAPRNVSADPVETITGEGEQYLFYRGVANLEAPLRVVRDAKENLVRIYERFDLNIGDSLSPGMLSTRLWLLDVRADGTVAYRSLGEKKLASDGGSELLATASEFDPAEYSTKRLTALRKEMHSALVEDGLFADEAAALLKTWEAGYFKSPGMRLFFLLPQEWTDAVLPLNISVADEREVVVTRTMVGRIELVTPRHRKLLDKIARHEIADLDWYYNAIERMDSSDEHRKFWEGTAGLREANISIPPEYQAYLDLGRFRNALILDVLSERKLEVQDGLKRFVDVYQVKYFQVDPES